jgi:poly-gamma-glutamate biosynthesis protein PgsC/CapC
MLENSVFYETLFLGIVVAVIYTELMDVYPGGIIVPAYFAFFLDQPLRVGITLLAAGLGLLCYRILSQYLILFGKRRFVILVLLGACWAQIWHLVLPQMFPSSLEMRAIGWIIPGLLANNLDKQRSIPTLVSLLVVSVITYFLVHMLVWIGF